MKTSINSSTIQNDSIDEGEMRAEINERDNNPMSSSVNLRKSIMIEVDENEKKRESGDDKIDLKNS